MYIWNKFGTARYLFDYIEYTTEKISYKCSYEIESEKKLSDRFVVTTVLQWSASMMCNDDSFIRLAQAAHNGLAVVLYKVKVHL